LWFRGVRGTTIFAPETRLFIACGAISEPAWVGRWARVRAAEGDAEKAQTLRRMFLCKSLQFSPECNRAAAATSFR
jgi:hypothetical protein